jgi:hypothetical protein
MKKLSQKGQVELLLVLIMIIVLVLVAFGNAIVGWTTDKTFDGTLTKTYVDRGNTYFVVMADGQQDLVVYENEDAWFFLKWNSGDILRDLNVDGRYTFHTYGWRVPFLSWFPNIVSATPIGQ